LWNLVDAVIEIRRRPAEKELRQQSRVEGVVTKARSVALAARDLRRRALALGHANRVLERDRLRGLGGEGERGGEGEDEKPRWAHETLRDWWWQESEVRVVS
jgi:hypothetical protein